MSGRAGANPWRGEASLTVGGRELRLRPTFAALVAAEEELGALMPLVERAAAGELRLGEMAALFWHCLDAEGTGPAVSRAMLSEAVVEAGLAACAGPLRALLRQILQGGG